MTTPYSFKYGCVRAGFALIIIFLFRVISEAVGNLLAGILLSLPDAARYAELGSILITVVTAVILYGGSILVTAWALDFKFSDLKKIYHRPARLGKAVSWVVPSYGAAQLVNIAAIAIIFLISNQDVDVGELEYMPIAGGGASSALQTVLMVFMYVVAAPVLEEIWFRGVIQTSLSGCGHGFAIMVSALAFGLAHGNFQQACYATVIGIFLGYVRYATDSLIPSTIIHAIINAAATVMMLIMSNPAFIPALTKSRMGEELSADESVALALFAIYLTLMSIMILVGVCAAIGKLKNRRLYIPVNNFPALTKGKKFVTLILTPDFIFGFALCLIYMFGLWAELTGTVGAM